MTETEIKEYFGKTVYKTHPEYKIELLSPSDSRNIYLIVYLENGYCYCFLLVPCASDLEFENKNPSGKDLNCFMESNQFTNCVLKKVCLIYEYEKGKFKHKTFVPESI